MNKPCSLSIWPSYGESKFYLGTRIFFQIKNIGGVANSSLVENAWSVKVQFFSFSIKNFHSLLGWKAWSSSLKNSPRELYQDSKTCQRLDCVQKLSKTSHAHVWCKVNYTVKGTVFFNPRKGGGASFQNSNIFFVAPSKIPKKFIAPLKIFFWGRIYDNISTILTDNFRRLPKSTSIHPPSLEIKVDRLPEADGGAIKLSVDTTGQPKDTSYQWYRDGETLQVHSISISPVTFF